MKTFAAAMIAAALTMNAFAGAAAAQSADIPSGPYTLDDTHAGVFFTVRHIGVSEYTARFTKFTIDLTLDVEDLSKSTVAATVDPASVVTNHPREFDFDAEIGLDPKFLNGGEFPQITFQSTKVEPTGDTTAKITGDLTLLGVTKEVVLDAELVGAIAMNPFLKAPGVGFRATTTLDRSDFGMTYLTNNVPGSENPIVSPEVEIRIQAEFYQPQG